MGFFRATENEEIKITQEMSSENNNEAKYRTNSLDESAQLIEDQLILNKTSVLLELNKQIAHYEDMLTQKSEPAEILQLHRLIMTTKNLAEEYNAYKNPRVRGKFHLIFSAQVAILIAWFNDQGYKLSAELLTHARDNDVLNSVYTPIETNGIYNSSLFKNISNGSSVIGASEFLNEGSTSDRDLFYAIKKFDFSKSISATKVVTISDTYDFAKDKTYSGVTGLAVDAMVDAQAAGTIVTFKINWRLTPATKLTVKSSSLQFVHLGPGEEAIFVVEFNNSKASATVALY